MKKTLSVIIVITVIVLIALVGCKTSKIPGAPYDIAPTATGEPTNKVSITIVDIDASNNTTAAHDISVMLHYPNNSDKTTSAVVVSGTAELFVYQYGQYIVEILPNTINGYSNSVFDTIAVAGPYSRKTINRYEPAEFTVSTPVIQSFNQTGALFTYTLTYHTNTPRRITFTVQTNATTGVQYWFDPVSETVKSGDTVQFKIFVPAYYQLPRAEYISSSGQLKFKFIGTDAKLKLYFNKVYNITQNWHFYFTVPSFTTFNSSGGPYGYVRSFVFTSLGFDTANLTEAGEKILSFENFEINDFTTWRNHDYWGGVQECKINETLPNAGSLVEMPLVLPAYTTLNYFKIAYNNCYPLSTKSMRITLKFTYGNFIYKQTYEWGSI